MRRSWLAAFSLWLALALAPDARAVLTPSGDTLWNLTAGPYQIAVEVYPESSLGTLTIVDSLSGRSAVGTLYPAVVVDRPHGQVDEFIADGFFPSDVFSVFLGLGPIPPGSNPNQALVHVDLGDLDGVAFDGAVPAFGQFLLPVDQPPLSLFETSAVVITHYEYSAAMNGFAPITQTLSIDGVPEPGPALLALLSFGLLARRCRRRSGEATGGSWVHHRRAHRGPWSLAVD